MSHLVTLGAATYAIEESGPTMVCIVRDNTEGQTRFYFPKSLVLMFAREHLVRGLVRAIETGGTL